MDSCRTYGGAILLPQNQRFRMWQQMAREKAASEVVGEAADEDIERVLGAYVDDRAEEFKVLMQTQMAMK